MQRPPLPPFTHETALQKVQAAEDAWNSRDPERVALAYTADSAWRNRDEFFEGRAAIQAFLERKWASELHYKLKKELWAYGDNRISVRFEYEWQSAENGQWYRTHGNEHWEFDADGLMRRRDMSANDVPIDADDRRIGIESDTLSITENKMKKFDFGKAASLLLMAIFSIAFIDMNARAESLTGVSYKTVTIEDVDIFYREAGDPSKPTVLLLHGFPTSSHMFRELIPDLADEFHLVAPDYPGYGFSSMPTVDEFEYTFDNVARLIEKFIDEIGLDRYSIYLMDYGAPVGFRIAAAHPERVDTLIVQNGNAYIEGIDNNFWEPIREYWKDRKAVNKGLDNAWWINVKNAYQQPEMVNEDALRFLLTLGATKWQYTNGVPDVTAVSPDTWGHVQPLLDRGGNQEIQLQMFYSYGSNPPLYPQWQEYLRQHQPPTLIVWGEHDEIFPAAGAVPYKRDLEDLEYHLIDTGHFALETHGQEIAELMRDFLNRKVK